MDHPRPGRDSETVPCSLFQKPAEMEAPPRPVLTEHGVTPSSPRPSSGLLLPLAHLATPRLHPVKTQLQTLHQELHLLHLSDCSQQQVQQGLKSSFNRWAQNQPTSARRWVLALGFTPHLSRHQAGCLDWANCYLCKVRARRFWMKSMCPDKSWNLAWTPQPLCGLEIRLV